MEYAVTATKKSSNNMKSLPFPIDQSDIERIRTQMKLDILNRCIFPHNESFVPAEEVTVIGRDDDNIDNFEPEIIDEVDVIKPTQKRSILLKKLKMRKIKKWWIRLVLKFKR